MIGAAFTLTVSGAFLALSVATFAAAAVLVRRARRAEAAARVSVETSARFRTEGLRALAEAHRVHARCRPRPFDVGVVGRIGFVRGGTA